MIIGCGRRTFFMNNSKKVFKQEIGCVDYSEAPLAFARALRQKHSFLHQQKNY